MRLIIATVMAFFLAGVASAQTFDDAQQAWLTRDSRTAMRIWHELAENGDLQSQVRLAQIYEIGRVNHVYPDIVVSARWWRAAAEQGDGGSQWRLGQFYINGEGVPQDFVLAYMWLNLAAARGFGVAAMDRDRVARVMTRSDISEAQRLTREWQSVANDSTPEAETN